MFKELKTYEVVCDKCNLTVVVSTSNYPPKPDGWFWRSKKHFTKCYCPKCYEAVGPKARKRDENIKYITTGERCPKCNRIKSIGRGCPTRCDSLEN